MGLPSAYQSQEGKNSREVTFFQKFVSRSKKVIAKFLLANCLANMQSLSNVVLEPSGSCFSGSKDEVKFRLFKKA